MRNLSSKCPVCVASPPASFQYFCHGLTASSTGRLSEFLIVTQIALSLVLLFGAGRAQCASCYRLRTRIVPSQLVIGTAGAANFREQHSWIPFHRSKAQTSKSVVSRITLCTVCSPSGSTSRPDSVNQTPLLCHDRIIVFFLGSL
jgi:hypothetical protein